MIRRMTVFWCGWVGGGVGVAGVMVGVEGSARMKGDGGGRMDSVWWQRG